MSQEISNLSDQAWECVESNRLSEAKGLFTRLVALDSGDEEAWMMLGTLHGVFGEIEPALTCLGRALELDESYADAHLNLGKIRLMSGSPEPALASLQAAVQHEPGLVEGWQLLGGVYGRLEQFEAAETASRQALALLPGSVEARLHLANALRSQGRPEAGIDGLAQPIFVLGLPRSGTSLVAGCLAACGAWVGETLAGNASNPEGYFENGVIREGVLKAQLTQLGADPLGVRQLPRLAGQPAQPRLGGQVLEPLMQQGYRGDVPWLYKDAKLSLVWPMWRQAFPHARWVIVRRDPEAVVDSCLRTDFMRQHSVEPAFWADWARAYRQRLEVLKASGVWWREVEPQALVSEGPQALEPLVTELGLEWNAAGVGELVKPQHWHAPAVQMSEPASQAASSCPPLIVNSVPKSGTHLLGKLTSLLGLNDIPVRLYNNMAPRSMQVEETAERVRVGSVWPCLVPFEQLAEILLQVKREQFIQGHLPYSERLAQLMKTFGMRMVLMLRDPRAVAVSHANWVPGRDYLASHEFYQDKTPEERLQLAISGYRIEPDGPLELGLRQRFEHMLPWMDHPMVYTTRFEWLAGPEAGGSAEVQLRELRNIAAHLEIEVPEARLGQIAAELFGGTMTFKGGQIDAWKEVFSETHNTLIYREMGDLIASLGYEIDLGD